MDSSVEASRPGSTLTPKSPLGTKPRLAPKPFSLQKNSTIRSIHAPRTFSATSKSTINQSGKVEATGVPKVSLTTPVQKPPQQSTTADSKPSLVGEHIKDKSKTANESKESPQGEDPAGSTAAPGKSDPALRTTSVPKGSVTTPVQQSPQQTTTPDSKASPVSEHVKDKPKTTTESKESSHGEDTPDSSLTQSDPAHQTTGLPKVSLTTPVQKPPQQIATPDSKPSPVAVYMKDKSKTTNESKESPQGDAPPGSSVTPGKSDPAPQTTSVPTVSLTTPVQKPPQQTTTPDSKPSPVSEHVKDTPKTTNESKESPHGDDTVDYRVTPEKSDPAPRTTPTKEPPQFSVAQKEDVIQTNHEAPPDTVTNSEQKDEAKEDDKTSRTEKPEEPGSDSPSTVNPAFQWGGTRRRLSTKLTSKFESGGPPLSPNPTITFQPTYTKDTTNKPVSSAPQPSPTTPEPSNTDSNEGGLDYSGGGSIKRRISRLFDSASKPEVVTKKEEPEIITGSGGVKDRIKNWVMETGSEAQKPQVAPETRSRSFDSSSPVSEKTPKLAAVELPATTTQSTQAVAPSSKVSPVKQPAESPTETSKDAVEKPLERTAVTPGEHEQNKSSEVEVQLRNHNQSTDPAATNERDSGSSLKPALKRNNVKRRSVRFGIVETDDGGPPLILGSPSDSSSEEEEAPGDKSEENTPVSVPVYRRVGIPVNKDDEIQKKEEEQQKCLELEKRLKAEEEEQARLKLEEKRKKQEEEEREKEKARKREDLKRREEEKQREEERERARLKEEEMERQKKEEQERERLKEEERERQMELMLQRQREEERERMKQEEEQLRKYQEEMEKERQREERDKQRTKEVEESSIHNLEGKLRDGKIILEKQKEEKVEKEWVSKTERLRGEIEEGKELEQMQQRQKEEERERARQIEERLRHEEVERERLRKEAEERERERQRKLEEEQKMREKQRQEEERKSRELERRMQQEKEEEMERMRQVEKKREEERKEEERKRIELERRIQQEKEEEMERMRKIEKQREEVRREEEKKKQLEKERVEELERKMREDSERKRAKELEEKLRLEEEREKEQRLVDLQERAKEESNLISFDSHDVSQKPVTPHSPLTNTYDTPENLIEIVYDDFSVRKPQIAVEFDDFSVKPKRWGSQAKVETHPVQSWIAEPVSQDEVEVLAPVVVHPQSKVPEQVVKPDSPGPTPDVDSPEEAEEEEEEVEEEKPEETQLNSMDLEAEADEEEKESEDELYNKEDESEEEEEAQVNSYCVNGEDKDTDALIESEPDQQNGVCEQTAETDSPKPFTEHDSEVSSQDVDATDFHREPDFAPFPESATPLLDTSAQRSKVELGRRRSRTRPSRSLRLAQTKTTDWRDSTDEKETSSKQEDSDSEEEQPKSKIVCSPSPASQRVPTVPGLSPTALIAQLKRRTGGGGSVKGDSSEEGKQREDKQSQREEVAQSPSQLSRSPRTAPHLAGAALVLPPLSGTEGGAVSSPAWLKELKSKKRLSQYDSEA